MAARISDSQIDSTESNQTSSATAPGPPISTISPTPIGNTTSTLQGAHDFTVKGHPRFTNVGVNNVTINWGTIDPIDIMQKLLEELVLFNACHDSAVQDPDLQCHPGTREDVLKLLRDWIDNEKPDATKPIFWLHGSPGVGKSAIAHTIARSYSRDKVPATFFFYRSDPSRNDGSRLFTTLAWQLALSIPGLKIHIINSLKEQPDLPRKDVETQFQELIVKPFQALAAESSSQIHLSAPVIIIDGLDECFDERLQRRLLKIIGNAVNDHKFPLRFLICSRSEAHIQDIIDSFQRAPLCLDLSQLDNANRDIEKYLRAEFSRIASEQDLPLTWPGDERIQTIMYKSSGQFIYASTVIKIIDEDSSAITQLDIVLGLKPHGGNSPFAELDSLYVEILKRQRNWEFLNDTFSISITYSIISSSSSDDVKDYATLMNIPERELRSKLRGMRPLLMLYSEYIGIYHRSFLDFLKDASRSGQYHISNEAAQRRYLDLITFSMVRFVSLVFEQPDHRGSGHFPHQFGELIQRTPQTIILDIENWEKIHHPLLEFLDKPLVPQKINCLKTEYCRECQFFQITYDILMHFHSLRKTEDPVVEKCLTSIKEILNGRQIFDMNFGRHIFGSAAIVGLVMAILAHWR